MGVFYKLYQDNRTNSVNKGKWYARAIHPTEIGLAQLAEIMQNNCTVKKSDILAVLTELVETMKTELQRSSVVKLDGLGSFKIGIATKPATTAAEFNVITNVVGARINFRPTYDGAKGLGQKQVVHMLQGYTVQETPKNTVVTTVPAP